MKTAADKLKRFAKGIKRFISNNYEVLTIGLAVATLLVTIIVA